MNCGLDDAAGEPVAQEVVEPIRTQQRDRLFEQRIDRVIVEVARRKPHPGERSCDIGAVEHERLQVFVMILLGRSENKVDRVGERRM